MTKRCKVGEVAEVTKLAGFEFTKYIEYIPNGEIIAVRALNLKNGRLVLDDTKRISRGSSELLPRSKLSRNDIVLSYTGTVGESAQIDKDNIYHLAPNVAKITPNEKLINPQYLFFYIRGQEFRQQMFNYAHGSTQMTVPMKVIRELTIPLHERNTQDKIAHLLSSIDNKIVLNEKINDNLDEILQSVYQRQFGDCTQDGMLSDICDYSKDRIAVSALSLSNYYSTENMMPGKAGAVEALGLPSTVHTTRAKIGDVLVSNIRPYFKKIVYCQSECGCSTDVLCFTPKLSSMSAFLFSTLYADQFFDFMVAGSKGTKMPRGDKQQIMKYPVHKPSEEELAIFNELALPILAQINQNRTENTKLAALRDCLLPKLMSGEIDVSSIQL